MSRTNIVLKNTVWDLIYQVVVILLGFLAPRYIILVYGSSVNGLSASITQILSIILLLQSGAITAALYSLYNPIAENDITAISRQVSATDVFFRRLSYIFLILMIIAAVITSYTLQSELKNYEILIAFLILGLRSFLDLLCTAKYRIVFTAFERKYIISIGTMIEQVIYYGMVMVTIYFKWNYLFLFSWLLIGCLIKIFYLFVSYKKQFPYIKTVHVDKKEVIINNRNYALANEVSHSAVITSVMVIVSFLYGLKEASVLSIYAMVFTAINLVLSSFASAFGPSFANLYAEKGQGDDTLRVFSTFQYMFIVLGTFLLMCVAFLLIPFVNLYVGDVTDINYVNKPLAYLYIAMMLFSVYRTPYNILVSSCGFFKETWLQPVICAFISLVISILLGRVNYSLILIGPIVFYIINFVYQKQRLKGLISSLITNKVLALLFFSLLGLLLIVYVNRWIPIDVTVFGWLKMAVVCVLAALLYISVISALFFRKEFVFSIQYVKSLLGNHSNANG